jgi:hypothetical protein
VRGSGTTNVTFRSSWNTNRGTYNVTLRGTSGMLTSTDTVALTVR